MDKTPIEKEEEMQKGKHPVREVRFTLFRINVNIDTAIEKFFKLFKKKEENNVSKES